ncbi:MAG: PA2779 family protein [Syntrophobacterales bacterium]|nr:PA2779 family protein [Syntrophobacterales bacterium]
MEAAFTPSGPIALTPSDKAADLEKIRTLLEMKVVAQRLEDLGYSAEEIKEKLSQFTDAQLHAIAQKIDDLKVGQENAIILIAAVLFIVVLIIVLYNLLTGHRVTVTR